MDDIRLTRIEKKLDKVLEHAAKTDITLARQEVTLSEHIRRTVANEKAIEIINKMHAKYSYGIIAGLLGLIMAVLVHKYA